MSVPASSELEDALTAAAENDRIPCATVLSVAGSRCSARRSRPGLRPPGPEDHLLPTGLLSGAR